MNMNSRHCFCLLNLQTSRTYTHVQTRPRQPTYLQQPHQPQPPQPQHSRSFTRDPKRTPSHSKSSAPTFMRGKNNATDQRKNSEPIFKPIVLKVGYDNEQDDIGAELCGSSLDKRNVTIHKPTSTHHCLSDSSSCICSCRCSCCAESVNEILMAFKQNPTVESLALEAGVNGKYLLLHLSGALFVYIYISMYICCSTNVCRNAREFPQFLHKFPSAARRFEHQASRHQCQSR